MDWTTILVDVGSAIVPWAATFLIGVIIKYGINKIDNEYVKGVLARGTEEAFRSAEEVFNVYVKGLKKGRADGKLTAEEKNAAKKLAISSAKSNLGPKGLAKLAKVVGGGGVSKWLGNRVEGSVNALKTESASLKSIAKK